MATALLALSAAAPVLAQSQPENLGTFNAWTAWKANDGYGAICFISATPESSSPTSVNGAPVNRDQPSFLVLHRDRAPSVNADGTAARDANGQQVFRKARNEVQTLVGYPMRPTTDSFFHSATVDGKRYAMRSIPDDPNTTNANESEGAWLASTSDETGFVAALKAGNRLVVSGTSNRSGLELSDTYSLSGFTAAMGAIDRACP